MNLTNEATLAIGSAGSTNGITVTGALVLSTSSGNITQSQIAKVGGTSSFRTSASGATITLSKANLLRGAVSLNTTGTNGDASLTNDLAGGLILGASNVGGNLTVVSTLGNLTQSGSTSLTVSGTSSFTTSGSNATITLTNAANALTGAVALNGNGNASLTNSVSGTGTVLAASTVGGNLTVTGLDAFGITQTGALMVSGASSFTDTAGGRRSNLSTSTNALTGAVALNGNGNASLTNSVSGTGTVLAASTVGGNLTVTGLDTFGITQTGA